MAKKQIFKLQNKPVNKSKSFKGRWLTPNAAEREYKKELLSIVKLIRLYVNTELMPQLPYIINQATFTYPDNNDGQSYIQNDDWLFDLDKILLRIRENMRPNLLNSIKDMMKIGFQINNFNSAQFKKVVSQTIGVDIFQAEPWLKSQMENFSSQNIGLITDLSNDTLNSIKEVILLNVQQGTRFTDTAKDIQKRYNVSSNRAKLIARDQTAKLNASLTRLRQEEIGITEYIWQTSLDERVRPTHRANEGKTFKWDSPPKTGHPGYEINCRCTAIPVMDDLLK